MLTAALANFALRGWDMISTHREPREPDRTEDASRDKVVMERSRCDRERSRFGVMLP